MEVETQVTSPKLDATGLVIARARGAGRLTRRVVLEEGGFVALTLASTTTTDGVDQQQT